jgi:hypothetical protein
MTVRRPARPEPDVAPVEEEPAVVVRRPQHEQQPVSEPELAPALEPVPAERVRVLEREPEPVQPEPVQPEPVQPEPVQPEPVPVERPPLVAVPELAPEPEPVAAPAAVRPAAASTVVPIGAGSAPRRWNLWDLERLTREASGDDTARDEERTFLLMYLREFADADGLLPVDFDGLVRDSFGELVGSR